MWSFGGEYRSRTDYLLHAMQDFNNYGYLYFSINLLFFNYLIKKLKHKICFNYGVLLKMFY